MSTVFAQSGAVSEFTAISFYLLYAVTAVALVVFLARTLHRNGRIFLEDAFERPELAQAVNQLLVIGFYLLNLGYALVVYQLQPTYDSLTVAFNELVVKLGVLLLSLGAIHLLNMFVFWRISGAADRAEQAKDRARMRAPLPPAPAGFVPPPPGMTVAMTGAMAGGTAGAMAGGTAGGTARVNTDAFPPVPPSVPAAE